MIIDRLLPGRLKAVKTEIMPREGEIPQVSQVLPKSETEEERRLRALQSSYVPQVIAGLRQAPEVKVLFSGTWYPTVCVFDVRHQGDEPRWDCIDIVGRQDDGVTIGKKLLNGREAKNPQEVDIAFLRAYENANVVYGDPIKFYGEESAQA